jgi:hypothetical protein
MMNYKFTFFTGEEGGLRTSVKKPIEITVHNRRGKRPNEKFYAAID